MSNGNMKISRILHRSKEELTAAAKIAKQTSVADSFCVLRAKLDIQVLVRNGYQESDPVKKRLMRKHDTMLRYFSKTYKDYIAAYDFNQKLPEHDAEYRNCIWICWWQGIENAPEIVKVCVQSILKNAQGHKVVILTEENYKDFVRFPESIEAQYSAGIISRTHYSDLLRITLLSEYGGIWLDSTFFCTAPVFDQLLALPVWSVKRKEYTHDSVAYGRFANYALGCNYENRRAFRVIRDFWLHYWEENHFLMDYLLTDYLIVLVQQSDPAIAAAFDQIPFNNEACEQLLVKLGDRFDQEEWNRMKADTSLFKLTWKASFPVQANGAETYYGALMNGRL